MHNKSLNIEKYECKQTALNVNKLHFKKNSAFVSIFSFLYLECYCACIFTLYVE